MTRSRRSASVKESSVYRMEADTNARFDDVKKLARKALEEKIEKSVYPYRLKVHFRNRRDCDYFAELLKCAINFTDKEITFKTPDSTSKMKGRFDGEKTRKQRNQGLSDFHSEHWKGMPEFEQEDSAWVYHSLTVVFKTPKLYAEFANLVRQELSEKTKSIYYPEWTPEKARYKKWVSTLPPSKLVPRYPIYIVSKGRAYSRLTSKTLESMNVPYYIVVEPKEYDSYASVIDEKKILTLPYDSDPKNPTGPGRARNWCRDHSFSNGYDRHWVMDDNIHGFYRLHKNSRYRVADGAIFRAAEDFVNRYENIWVAGFQYRFFCAQKSKYPPFVTNTRIYSCLLIDNRMILELDGHEFLWRERYNEDTILSLDVLENGYCTVQFNAFLQGKVATQTLRGGNSEVFYDAEGTGDLNDKRINNYNPEGTIKKSLNLKEIYPEVTEIVMKYGRIHHQVDYSRYKANPLIKKKGIRITSAPNNYGMQLVDMTKEEQKTQTLQDKDESRMKVNW